MEECLLARARSCGTSRPWLVSLSDAKELDVDRFAYVKGRSEMHLA